MVAPPDNVAIGSVFWVPGLSGAYSVTASLSSATQMLPEESTLMPKGELSPVAPPDKVAMGASLQVGGVPVQLVRGREYSVTVSGPLLAT